MEGQVLSSPLIRVPNLTGPRPSVWKDHVRDGLLPKRLSLEVWEEGGGGAGGTA